MGILNFNTFIKKRTPYCIKEYDLSIFKDKSIAFDLLNIMFIINSRAMKKTVNKTEFVFDKEQGWSSIDDKVFEKNFYDEFDNYIAIFNRYNIVLYACFDGISPDEKEETHIKRMKKVEKDMERLNLTKHSLNDLQKYKKYLINSKMFTSEYFEPIKKMLKEKGHKVVISSSEGEGLASKLCRERIVHAVISTDTDLYAYSCPVIIRKIMKDGTSDPKAEAIALDDVVDEMFSSISNINEVDKTIKYNLLRLLCSMCGNDYFGNNKGYGPVKCYELIVKHFNIIYARGRYIPISIERTVDSIVEEKPTFNKKEILKSYEIFSHDFTYKTE